MMDEPVRMGRQAYKLIFGRSAIFKMADRSTINLYAGGGLVRHLQNHLLWQKIEKENGQHGRT